MLKAIGVVVLVVAAVYGLSKAYSWFQRRKFDAWK